jgi:hypothetical protein
MKQLVSNLKGDKGFGHLALLALFSMPLASSNLAYIGQEPKYIRLFGETHRAYLYWFHHYFHGA